MHLDMQVEDHLEIPQPVCSALSLPQRSPSLCGGEENDHPSVLSFTVHRVSAPWDLAIESRVGWICFCGSKADCFYSPNAAKHFPRQQLCFTAKISKYPKNKIWEAKLLTRLHNVQISFSVHNGGFGAFFCQWSKLSRFKIVFSAFM